MPTVGINVAEFQRNFGHYQEAAMREPVAITNHGRESLVLLSADEYGRLKRRDREVLQVAELSPEEIDAIVTAEIPAELAAFDHEVP